MRKNFLPFLLMFFVLHGSGYATTCVPKTMTEPPAENPERYLLTGQPNENGSYAYCGKSGDRFYDCDVNTFAVGYDRYVHQCTETGWKRISYDNIKPCDDDLLKVLIQYQYNDYTGTYNNGYDQTQYEWVLFHEYISDDGNYININPDGSCKYPQDKFDAAQEDCRTKDKGWFLSRKGENNIVLCEPVEQININVTVKDADSEQPLDGVQIKYKDPFHDERDDLLTDAAGQATIEFNHRAKEIVIKFHKDGYANTSKIMSYLDAQSTPVIKLAKLPESISNNKNEEQKQSTTKTHEQKNKEKQSIATPESNELDEKLKAANDALNKAKEKENSWANRALGATTTAATSLGAMQLAEGIAEKKADEKAEKEMRNYISTMKCEYGGGQEAVFGNEEITLPGGNELLEYYTEYKTLADNLKTTKAALGLSAGIESEVLYDRAQSGLYQYASTGKTGGGETSLFRALTDSESEDATAWSEQKETASKKLKVGGGVAAGGAAVGVIGNAAINTDMIQNIKDAFKKD